MHSTGFAFANYPFPRNTAYKYGIQPDISQSAMNVEVQKSFEKWFDRYVTNESCTKDALRVSMYNSGQHATVSEGIAWGMMILVLMDNEQNNNQIKFDSLYRYYKKYLNKYGLMAWKIDRHGKAMFLESATEADENCAMALFYADKQWGSANGINYKTEAINLIDRIMLHEIEKDSFVVKGGAEWGGSDATNPAYYNPAFYRVWAKHDEKWAKVLNRSYELYDSFYQNRDNIFFPDWCRADGTKSYLSYDFSYDACQVPIKIGIDYLWNGEGQKYLDRINEWTTGNIKENDPLYIVDGYTIEGKKTGRYNNSCFVVPFCISAMSGQTDKNRRNKSASYLLNIYTGGDWGYYNDTLRMIGLLILSGNFTNLWD